MDTPRRSDATRPFPITRAVEQKWNPYWPSEVKMMVGEIVCVLGLRVHFFQKQVLYTVGESSENAEKKGSSITLTTQTVLSGV